MAKFELPKCPSCGKKLNWFRAWSVKTQGEFRCGRCGFCSNVALNRLLYILAFAVAGVSAVLFLVLVVLVKEFNFLSLFWVVLPFLLFFLVSPFFVRLRPPVPKAQPSDFRIVPGKHAGRPRRAVPPPRNNGNRRVL